ncbi:MAG: NADH-quinone oxidoreductase subunit J [Gemmataceae bacterium]|nr:NADH-quinone oxidoreductase subunit J [Planctomycetia bacterium]MBX3398781.1 NADH-quinone oxidoreductase subunit J [Gemmataceae bacterium]
MTLDLALFVVLASVIAASAIGVVVSHTIVRSAVFLLFTLIGVAFLYFLIGAEFLGAAQLIVYVGGTLVLLVFGGMLTSGGPFQTLKVRRLEWLFGGLVALAIFAALAQVSLALGQRPTTDAPLPPGAGPLGVAFLTSHLLPFEIVSVHLLVVLVGAAYLARTRKRAALGSEDSASPPNGGTP